MAEDTLAIDAEDMLKAAKAERSPPKPVPAPKSDSESTEAASLTLEEALKVHASFREKACHEDGLINQRKTWLVLSQTFLIGALVLLLSNTIIVTEYAFLVELVVLVGLISSFSACLGILAAHLALFGTKRRYDTYPGIKKWKEQLPELLGGGSYGEPKKKVAAWFSVYLGLMAGFLTPIVLVLAWAVAAQELEVRPFGEGFEVTMQQDKSGAPAVKAVAEPVTETPKVTTHPQPEEGEP